MTVSHCIDRSPLSKVRGKFYHSGAMLEIPPGGYLRFTMPRHFSHPFLHEPECNKKHGHLVPYSQLRASSMVKFVVQARYFG